MVIASNQYLNMNQMKENAIAIYQYMVSKGWSINAIAGMMGNMQTESTMNPGLWQNRTVYVGNGYGLVQWTPSSNFINWANANGRDITDYRAQIDRIQYEMDIGIEWYPKGEYQLTFKQFKTSNRTPEWLAQAFLKNYERPKNQNQPLRSTQARFWYNFLNENGGSGGDPSLQYEIAQFPMDMINVTQGENGTFSHMGIWAMDFVGTYHQYPYYAPCEVECITAFSPNQVVVWKTTKPVVCADGVLREFFFDCIHENTLWQTPGMILQKGELMGHTGVGGHATGDHLHLQVMEGTNYQGFTTNSQGASTLVGTELHIYDVFSVEGVNIVNGMGYDWKIYDGSYYPPYNPYAKGGELVKLLLSNNLYKGW